MRLLEAGDDQLFTNWRNARQRWRLDLGVLDRVLELLDGLVVEAAWVAVRTDACFVTDLARDAETDAGKVLLQERADGAALTLLDHLEQDAEFDAVRMRLDLLDFLGQFRGVAQVFGHRAVRLGKRQVDVRVGHRHQLQELRDAALAAPVLAFHRNGDFGAVLFAFPLDCLVTRFRPILRGVDADRVFERQRPLAGFAAHADWLAGGQLAIHAGGADADALLATRLAQPVELAAVEQPTEHVRHLCLDDAGTVVLNDHRELLLVGADAFDRDLEVGQDACFFAGIEAVVDGFLDRGQQCLARAVKAEQVAVLGEELADRDLPLLLGHGLGIDRGLLAAALLGFLAVFALYHRVVGCFAGEQILLPGRGHSWLAGTLGAGIGWLGAISC